MPPAWPTSTIHVPEVPVASRTLSTLLRRSSLPPETLNPLENWLAMYTVPSGEVALRSRSFTSLAALWSATAEPSLSFQTSVISML